MRFHSMSERTKQQRLRLLLVICLWVPSSPFTPVWKTRARHDTRRFPSTFLRPEDPSTGQVEADFSDPPNGQLEDATNEEFWDEIEQGQPSELLIMKEILGINVFTYILAGAIIFFLTMNTMLGSGWLGSNLGIPGTGTFTEQSKSLPQLIDLTRPEYTIN